MSRCYRISVSESLRRHIEVEDGLETSLELLDILPASQMRALLEDQLSLRGYTHVEGTTWRKTREDGVIVTVDTEKGTVGITLSDEAELELERKKDTIVGDADQSTTKEVLRQLVRGELEDAADEETTRLRVEVTRRLEAALESVRRELDDAVNRATGEALKQKARQLGEVTEISEDPATGAITIRVKV